MYICVYLYRYTNMRGYTRRCRCRYRWMQKYLSLYELAIGTAILDIDAKTSIAIDTDVGVDTGII